MKQERMVKKAALFVWALIILIIRAPSSVPSPLLSEHIFPSQAENSRTPIHDHPASTAVSRAGLESEIAVTLSYGQYFHPLLPRIGLWQGSLDGGCAP